ncbi:putative nuclease HARBI1 [Centruroides vittatus]|uniref:putative nuclease HARBI1 n=1 Tax=Centruroides vittatus TaxID=120091 RepID=UPI00351083C1
MDDIFTASVLNVLSICSESVVNPNSSFFRNDYDEPEDSSLIAAIDSNEEYREERYKISGYVHDIVPKYSDDIFKSHFRLTRSTVEILLSMLPQEPARRKARIPKETSVLFSLWFMGNQESYRGVCDRFGLGFASGHREFTKFCTSICALSNSIIKMPQGFEIERIRQGFQKLRVKPFPGTIGCIDGTHIAFSVSKEEKNDHINRKGYPSVVLQAICDHELKFLDVYAGWPGSANDARVFRNSPLFKNMEEKEDFIPSDCHILGDCAYPLNNKIMTPYRNNGHLTRKQKLFNTILSSTRVLIEQAFAHLFGRFRKLIYIYVRRREFVPDVIVAACVLHNLCIMHNDITPGIYDQLDLLSCHSTEQFDAGINKNDSGAHKRDQIADYLFNLECA